VERLQSRHDFASSEELNLELVVGHFRNLLHEKIGTAVNRVKRLWKARRHAPLDLGRRLRNRGRSNSSDGGPSSRNFQKITTFHSGISLNQDVRFEFQRAVAAALGFSTTAVRSGAGSLTRSSAAENAWQPI